MGRLILEVVLLYVALCFCPSQSQGKHLNALFLKKYMSNKAERERDTKWSLLHRWNVQ